jgi:hypothetical protein
MNDIFHEWGADLVVGSGGDIALANGSDMISQKICRRLLTNANDYIWNSNYGGGLAQFVGTPANPSHIQAIVSNQLSLEASVPTTPPPLINVGTVNPANGYLIANITYVDPISSQPVILNVAAG